jgi:aromatic-L-amino-acid/L-tryptophan decarboxylase
MRCDALRAAIEADGSEGLRPLADPGLQLTRTSRALKLWLSVRYFGLAAFRRAIDASLDLAEHAQRQIEEGPELELVTGTRPA